MGNQIMTSKQFDLLKTLNNTLIQINEQEESFQELVDDMDLFTGKIADIQGDLERGIDIFDFIKRYENKELEEIATIGISNNMGVAIVEAESDFVFGYMEFDSGKQFFLSEIEYKVDEDNEDDESIPMFTIGEDGMELSLANAMRIKF